MLKASNQAVDLIKQSEGRQLKAYRCPAGTITIGYGHTKGVYEGQEINDTMALEMLWQDVKTIDLQLSKVNLKVNQNQYNAIVSFVFNLGFGNFLKSTLFDKVTSNPNDPTIRDEFMKWRYAAHRELPGLVKRRKAEADLYFKK